MPWASLRARDMFGIILLALLVRAVFFVGFSLSIGPEFPVFGSDSRNYVDVADGFLETGNFIYADTKKVVSYEMPGYPVFLSLFRFFTNDTRAVVLAQYLLAALIAAMVYAIGSRWSHSIGLASGILFAIDPIGAFYASGILTETLYLFLLVAGVLPLLKPKHGIGSIVASGVLFGAATMVRPIAEIYIPIAALFIVFTIRRADGWKRAFALALVFIVTVFIVVAPWAIRNKLLFDRYELSAVASWQFYHSHAPHFYAYKNNIAPRDAERIFEERLKAIDPYQEDFYPSDVGSLRHAPYMWRVAWEYIRTDVPGFLWFYGVKTLPFFFSDGLREITREMKILPSFGFSVGDAFLRGDIEKAVKTFSLHPFDALLLFLGFFFWSGVFCLAVVGTVALYKNSRFLEAAFFVLIIFATAAVAGGAVAHPRYRFSITPFLFLLMAAGFMWLKDRYAVVSVSRGNADGA